MRLGVVVLVHEYHASTELLINRLKRDFDGLCIHVDGRASKAVLGSFKRFETPTTRVFSAQSIVWGRWGMVSATVDSVRSLLTLDPTLDYVVVLSGSDYPIQSTTLLRRYLTENPYDYIEAYDIFRDRWVLGGPQAERLYWWFPFDFWKQRRLFDLACHLQRKYKYRRSRPKGFHYAIGSQWCVLRAGTWRMVLEKMTPDGKFVRYMKKVWIPDEIAIQTLVRTFVPATEIVHRSMTLYHYSEYGRPVQFFSEHARMLTEQGFFFARKLAASAMSLRRDLDSLAGAESSTRAFQFGHKTKELLLIGRHIRDEYLSFPRINKKAGAGLTPTRGRRYFAIFCQKEVTSNQFETFCKRLDNTTYFGPIFAGPQFVAPSWLHNKLGLTIHDWKIRDCFPHDILTFVLDQSPSIPVIVLPQDSSIFVLDRIIQDNYATKIVLQVETPVRSGYVEWIIGKLKDSRAAYEVRHL